MSTARLLSTEKAADSPPANGNESLTGKAPYWPTILTLAVLYFATAKVGQLLAIPPGNVTPVWIPSGIILAFVMARGNGVWPGIFLGAFAGNVSAHFSADTLLTAAASVVAGIANGTGDVLCAVVAAVLIRRTVAGPALETARGVAAFIVYGAVLGPFLSTLFGVTGLALTGLAPWADYRSIFITWWTGDGVGVLILTPLLLTLATKRDAFRRRVESAVYVAGVLVFTAFAVGVLGPAPQPTWLFAVLPLLMWSVFRLDPRVTCTALLLVTSLAILGTVFGSGVFQAPTLNQTLVQLQLFVAIIAVAVLVMQAAFNERRGIESALEAERTRLEERVQARTRALQESQRATETLMSNLPGIAYRCRNDPAWTMEFVSEGCEALLGYSPDDLRENHVVAFADLIDGRDRDSVASKVAKAMERGESFEVEYRVRRRDGTVRWVWEQGQRVARRADGPDILEGYIADITERVDANSRLRLAATVLASTSEGVVVTGLDGTIVEVNDAFVTTTGYSREDAIGANPRFLQSGRQGKEFYDALWEELLRTGAWRGELWNRRADGSVFPERMTINALYDESGNPTGYVGVFADITSLEESQRQLAHLAHHDALTDLPNRVQLTARLTQSLHRASRNDTRVAVVFIDLDRFKSVNDTLGHAAGDELLQRVAERLTSSVRMSDTIARLGGDEFVALLEDFENSAQASATVDKLQRAFEHPFEVGDAPLRVTASIGVSLFPEDGEDEATLMRNADAAMYRAKDDGRNTLTFYREELSELAHHRASVETALGTALQDGEFHLAYQPQIDIGTGRLVGVEALVRWDSKSLGAVSPAEFIPVAEHSGVIREIGRWVMQQACEQAARWLADGVDVGRVAVNVAASQVQAGDLDRTVGEVLELAGLAPSRLEIEVTEGSVMRRTRDVVEQLERVRARGVSIAIDDFGTGYSSLSYLKELPIDRLKIDRSFVRDIPRDGDDMAITEAIISMTRALGIDVIAEGVETDAQAAFLLEKACPNGQGYLWCRPVSADDLTRSLAGGGFSPGG